MQSRPRKCQQPPLVDIDALLPRVRLARSNPRHKLSIRFTGRHTHTPLPPLRSPKKLTPRPPTLRKLPQNLPEPPEPAQPRGRPNRTTFSPSPRIPPSAVGNSARHSTIPARHPGQHVRPGILFRR
ncbi:MAG: hypothetical protein ACK559_36645, partial [bacterium]